MSQANVDYILKHNHEIDPSKVKVCPNSIDVVDKTISDFEKENIRRQYNLPLNKKIFIYGGNLGKPQGIDFMIQCLEVCKDLNNVFFLIVGSGTEYYKIEEYIKNSLQTNVRLMKSISKSDYDTLLMACDCGLIFLDHRFTIPNFPSRLLYYMQAKIPILAVTDRNTDVGKVIVDGDLGWWIISDDTNKFRAKVIEVINNNIKYKGMNAWEYLQNNYTVNISYNTINKNYT